MARFLFAPLLAVLVAATPLTSQTIRGRVVEATGEGVATALLNLIAGDGSTVRSAVSGEGGAFSITAPTPGRYTLRIERIGFAPHTTGAFDLAEGEVVVRTIAVAAAPVMLEAVRAETSARCVVRPQDGSALAQLFEAARTALGVSAQVEASRTLSMGGVRYLRELDASGRRQSAVRERADFSRPGVPFDAVPLTTLSRVGFAVREADGRHTYFGPSARTLLSEQFLEDHCFRRIVDNRAEPDVVGLGFEPVRGTERVGLAGTIWIDRTTAVVDRIEYEYRNVDDRSPQPARGYVEFGQLDDGRPFIVAWRIQMPILLQQPTRRLGQEIRVIGLLESGGLVHTVDGERLGRENPILAQLDEAGADDPRRARALVRATEISRLTARGGSMVDALRLLGGVVEINTGRYWTYDHVADDIICVQATGVPRDPATLAAARPDEFCDMLDVMLDGELVESPGIALQRIDVRNVMAIEFLGSLAAAERLGEEPVAPLLIINTYGGRQHAAAAAEPDEVSSEEAVEGAAQDNEARLRANVVELEEVRVEAARSEADRSVRSSPTRMMLVTEARVNELMERGARLEDAVREIGGLRVRQGRFRTTDHGPLEILCIEAGRGVDRLTNPATGLTPFAGNAPFCDMVAVVVDGVRIGEGGAYLRNIGLEQFAEIQVLSASDAAQLLGTTAGSGALLLTTRRSGR